MRDFFYKSKKKIVLYLDSISLGDINIRAILIIITLVMFSLAGAKNSQFFRELKAKSHIIKPTALMNKIDAKDPENRYYLDHLPKNFRYIDINKDSLRRYLVDRNSLLAYDPYFSTIINTAERFRLNPIVLFSIAGHEQGFVNRDNEYSMEVVNNPYNVFGSWKEYNTNIKDSTEIACRTVINLLKNKPDDVEPFKWINRKYAEDKNWWIGVSSIFKTLYNISN